MRSSILLVSFSFYQALSCSNFILNNDDGYGVISGRTSDISFWQDFSLEAVPVGHIFHGNNSVNDTLLFEAEYGFVGFYVTVGSSTYGITRSLTAGLNEKGVSCDIQELEGTEYPKLPSDHSDITPVDSLLVCEWVLASFASVAEVTNALSSSSSSSSINPPYLIVGNDDLFHSHFSIRDALGESIVIEFIQGNTNIHIDNNDNGVTGYGIMTNEPPLPWHIMNTDHLEWKRSMARPAVAIPGGFYPDERFLRLHLLKEGLDMATSYVNKIQQALYLIDSVSVAPGHQVGTDSSHKHGQGDKTVIAIVYDHSNATLYWRTFADHSLKRVQLSDMDLDTSSSPNQVKKLSIFNDLPWFTDASAAFV